MPATVEEVKNLIAEAFPGSDVNEIIEDQNNHRIVGTFRAPEFRDKDIDERRRLLASRVRDKLGLRGLNVGLIVPLAPGEQL